MGFSVFKLGSEKITSVALESFFSRADKVRSLIQDSLEFVFNVKFLESVDTTRLQKILPIFFDFPGESAVLADQSVGIVGYY